MVIEIILRELEEIERQLQRVHAKMHFHYPRRPHKVLFSFFINTLKINFMSGSLTVPTGTPVTGSASPVDVKGNVLPDSAFKPGSCKWSVLAPADGSAAPFSIAPGDSEEDFVITEANPGSASSGTILFDAQDANGNQLPQASAALFFTAIPAIAVGSQINFDQTSH